MLSQLYNQWVEGGVPNSENSSYSCGAVSVAESAKEKTEALTRPVIQLGLFNLYHTGSGFVDLSRGVCPESEEHIKTYGSNCLGFSSEVAYW